MQVLSTILSIIAIVISFVGVIVSIITTKLQYKRKLNIEVCSGIANFSIINGKQTKISSFVYTITNIGNLPIYIKEIGIWGIDGNKKPKMIEIGHYKPSSDEQSVKLETQNSIDYCISMKDMSDIIKSCVLKYKVRNFIACVKCSNGKIFKHNFGDAKKFYKAHFYEFEK